MDAMKQKAADTVASTKAGAEKAKATVTEKVDQMKGDNAFDKNAATVKKEATKGGAEVRKQEAHAQNAAERQANT